MTASTRSVRAEDIRPGMLLQPPRIVVARWPQADTSGRQVGLVISGGEYPDFNPSSGVLWFRVLTDGPSLVHWAFFGDRDATEVVIDV